MNPIFVLFLPQLVQALKAECWPLNSLSQHLIERALSAFYDIALPLFWLLKVEETGAPPHERSFWSFIINLLKSHLDEEQLAVLNQQEDLFGSVGLFAAANAAVLDFNKEDEVVDEGADDEPPPGP